ncbi:hypothetical protein TEA_004373 [Camellia sinensis var. sinensis]|uniref:UBZ3-type domain-containing protein n=1 Tax=Camellia sinensis var. sinensis TaxID=542762 RepID=A0A4S4CWU2_CAMSN|nr:hypothetical protein TEA_004373 [Camellia sinensis var. sinensis]
MSASVRTKVSTSKAQTYHTALLESDLAEMLSADMKKEALCGRTLTLKMKTASFEVNTPEMIGHTLKSYEAEASQLVKIDLDTMNKRTNLSDDAVSSSNQNEQSLWVDDYKCLLCGIEMPSSFVEERQEHSDFHLAERLQKEESDSNPRSLTPKKRYCVVPAICIIV